MSDHPETLELLCLRVDALERRVHDLEQGSPAVALSVSPPVAVAAAPDPGHDLPSGEQVSGAFLLLGKSMLGIAGAYLLRALAESGVLPRLLIAAVAIAYAIGWLLAAARTAEKARFAAALYAGTSALILAPMLWELTMRFHVLAPAASAGVLGLFVGAATVLSRGRKERADVAVAYGAAALTSLALSIVTHEMIAFLLLLLAMLAWCESTRSGLRAVGMLVAGVSDCAAWFLIVIYRTAASTRSDYPALGTAALFAPASVLLLIAIASVVYRTVRRQERITIFETAQSVVAFLLWILSGFFLVPDFSTRMVGMVCLVFSAACYAAGYALFRPSGQSRNFHVFALWSACLFLAGVYLTLPAAWATTCLALAAIVSAGLAVRICCTTLECHGIIYLGVAALSCGLLEYSFHALAGNMPASVAWTIFLVAACALICYVAMREREHERWQLQLLHLAPALLAVLAAAGLTAQGSLWLLARRITPEVFHVAFIRTLILCAIALALAFAGARWRRLEFKRIAYGALAFIAAKLVFEDLRHGHMGFIAASIFLFAVTLIGVPRLARAGSGLRVSRTT